MIQEKSPRLNSFDELLESDHRIFVEVGVHQGLMENPKYHKAFNDGRILTSDGLDKNFNVIYFVEQHGSFGDLRCCEFNRVEFELEVLRD